MLCSSTVQNSLTYRPRAMAQPQHPTQRGPLLGFPERCSSTLLFFLFLITFTQLGPGAPTRLWVQVCGYYEQQVFELNLTSEERNAPKTVLIDSYTFLWDGARMDRD